MRLVLVPVALEEGGERGEKGPPFAALDRAAEVDHGLHVVPRRRPASTTGPARASSSSTGVAVSAYHSTPGVAGDDVLREHDVVGAAVLRVRRRGLVGDDADAQPRHEVLGGLARVERVGVGVPQADDRRVEVAQTGRVACQEHLAADVVLVLVELSRSGRRRPAASAGRVAVEKHDRHVGLLVRVERQVALDQFEDAVAARRPGSRLCRPTAVPLSTGRLVQAVVLDGVGEREQFRLVAPPPENDLGVERVASSWARSLK